jgi:allophanate hydrolase subunit 2
VITLLAKGFATSVVGEGHPGRAWLGSSRGGAVDLSSFHLANRLLGNQLGTPMIETSGGATLRFERSAMVVLTGAVADVRVTDGPPLGWGAPVVLPGGATVMIGRLLDGARVYVGVRGGIEQQADVLHIGTDPGHAAATEPAPRVAPHTTLRVWPGPRREWFTLDAWQRLLHDSYTVTVTSRVGTRLSGPPLLRTRVGELPSEGLVEGAVQVPPDGQPIVMLADHPATGGYPVIAVVDPADVAHVAQAPAGTVLRFTAQ